MPSSWTFVSAVRDGVEAALEIWQRFHIRSVFVSGNIDEAMKQRAAPAQPLGFVSKPPDPNRCSPQIILSGPASRSCTLRAPGGEISLQGVEVGKARLALHDQLTIEDEAVGRQIGQGAGERGRRGRPVVPASSHAFFAERSTEERAGTEGWLAREVVLASNQFPPRAMA